MNETQAHDNDNVYKIQMHRWRMAFFGLIILIAGIAIGAASSLLVVWRFPMGPVQGPEHTADRMLQGLRHNLDLSPEQREQIEPIIHKHMEQLDRIRRDARPLIESELRQMNEEISPILDDQQRTVWKQMQQRLPNEPGPDRMRPMPNPQPPFGQPPRRPPTPENPEPPPPQ